MAAAWATGLCMTCGGVCCALSAPVHQLLCTAGPRCPSWPTHVAVAAVCLTPTTLCVLLLQALWLLGVLGALYVASQQPGQPLPLVVAAQPWTIWFVGPAAAAVTGVAIKEGEWSVLVLDCKPARCGRGSASTCKLLMGVLRMMQCL